MARILLADDDKGARDLVRRALEMDGHTVVMAEDGNEALAALQTAAFDVLVADVEMPGLDGVELAKRAMAGAGGMRIVLMSGSHELLDKGRQLKAPKARFVAKPFTIEQMRSEVRAVIAA